MRRLARDPARVHSEELVREGSTTRILTWFPTSCPKGVVLHLHGLNEHAGRASPWVAHAVPDGAMVVAPDLRGERSRL
jgi:alpha-beta hydrolase superfamily lysophospholipase